MQKCQLTGLATPAPLAGARGLDPSHLPFTMSTINPPAGQQQRVSRSLLLDAQIGQERFVPCETFTEHGWSPNPEQAEKSHKGQWIPSAPSKDDLKSCHTLVFFNVNDELMGWATKDAGMWREAGGSPGDKPPRPRAQDTDAVRYVRVARAVEDRTAFKVAGGRADFAGQHKEKHREHLVRLVEAADPDATGHAVLLEGKDATLSVMLRDQGRIQEPHIIIPNFDPFVCHTIKHALPTARIFACSLGDCIDRLQSSVPSAVGSCALIWADYCVHLSTYGKHDIPAIFTRDLPARKCVLAVTATIMAEGRTNFAYRVDHIISTMYDYVWPFIHTHRYMMRPVCMGKHPEVKLALTDVRAGMHAPRAAAARRKEPGGGAVAKKRAHQAISRELAKCSLF